MRRWETFDIGRSRVHESEVFSVVCPPLGLGRRPRRHPRDARRRPRRPPQRPTSSRSARRPPGARSGSRSASRSAAFVWWQSARELGVAVLRRLRHREDARRRQRLRLRADLQLLRRAPRAPAPGPVLRRARRARVPRRLHRRRVRAHRQRRLDPLRVRRVPRPHRLADGAVPPRAPRPVRTAAPCACSSGSSRRRRTTTAQRFWVRIDGRLLATPLLTVLVLVEITDIVFAVDSIPAIFAVTQEPFLVFTSNAFAILGLRALYFLLADLIDRFVYLKLGLAIVLVWVGVKMLLLDVWKVPTLALARRRRRDHHRRRSSRACAPPARASSASPRALPTCRATGPARPSPTPIARTTPLFRSRPPPEVPHDHHQPPPPHPQHDRSRPVERQPPARTASAVIAHHGRPAAHGGAAAPPARGRSSPRWCRCSSTVSATSATSPSSSGSPPRRTGSTTCSRRRSSPAPAAGPEVGLGSRVLLRLAGGVEEWVRPVHPVEAFLDEERISATSPLSQALLGASVGQTVTVHGPSSTWRCRVVEVRDVGDRGARRCRPADTRVAPADTRGVGEARSRARAHLRARDWARGRRTTHLALKAVVLASRPVAASPPAWRCSSSQGPAGPRSSSGLVVLASEFTWAERLLDPLKRLAERGLASVRTWRRR